MTGRSTTPRLVLTALALGVAGAACWSLVPGEEGGQPAAPRTWRAGPTRAPGPSLEPAAATPRPAGVAPPSTGTTPTAPTATLPLAAPAPGPAQGVRVVEGRVVAAEDPLRPIEGALVSGRSATWSDRGRTDVDGRFRFTGVPLEEARLVVTAEGRSPAVVEGAAPLAAIGLERGRTLRVRVAGPRGEPAQGPTVSVLEEVPSGAPRVHAATPDAEGRLVVTGLRRDARVAVVASAVADGAPVASPLPPAWQAPGDEVTGTLAALRTVELRGVPLSAPDLVLVSASSILTPFPIDARTEGGVHWFEGVTPGPWQVRARTGEAAGGVFEVPVGDPSTRVVIDGSSLEVRAPRD